jgi:hypothetical protein
VAINRQIQGGKAHLDIRSSTVLTFYQCCGSGSISQIGIFYSSPDPGQKTLYKYKIYLLDYVKAVPVLYTIIY